MSTTPIFEIKNLHKEFIIGHDKVEVLKDINLLVDNGDFLVIFGPSGCGKSTLLHCMLGLEHPSSGIVNFMGKNLYSNSEFVQNRHFHKINQENDSYDFDEDGRSEIRKRYMGMVYQQPNWIKSLTVIENVAFPLQLLGKTKDESLKKAWEMLDRVQMTDKGSYMPPELSSGQQQRVALARALTSNPSVIIADEPTGNLDYEAGQNLMALLEELNQKSSTTILMVTHDLDYLKFSKSIVKMFNGEVVEHYTEKDKKSLLMTVKNKKIANHV